MTPTGARARGETSAYKWTVTPVDNPYVNAYGRAQREYSRQTEEHPEMTAAEKAKLKNDLYQDVNKTYVKEGSKLNSRIGKLVKETNQELKTGGVSEDKSPGTKVAAKPDFKAPSKVQTDDRKPASEKKPASVQQRTTSTTGGGPVITGGADEISFSPSSSTRKSSH